MSRRIRSCLCLALATLLMLVLATNTELWATPPPTTLTESIDRYLENAIEQWKIPGLAVAIVKGDRVFYAKGFGKSDDRNQIAANTPFMIGSLSKSLTATAIVQLAEAGKIDLQAPVQRYLPWFRVASDLSDRIKIVDLLYHTSGLSMQTDIDYVDLRGGESNGQSLEKYVRRLATAKLSCAPGTQFKYANANYAILGMTIQQVAGVTYEQYIQSHIFQPLEMEHSYTSLLQAVQSSPPLSTGYQFWLNQPVAAAPIFDRQNLPAGYLISSATDIAQYLMMNLNGGSYQGKTVISPASLKQIHTPGVSAWGESTYAMGWVNDRVNNIPIEYHGGELANFSSSMTLIPSQDWGIVILTNVFPGLIGDPIRKLYVGVINILQGSNPPVPKIEVGNSLLIYGLPIVLMIQIGFFWRSLCQNIRRRLKPNYWFWIWRICLPAIFHGSIALAILVLPIMLKIPLSIAMIAQPDLVSTALGCSGVALCSFLRTILMAGLAIDELSNE